MSEDKVTYIYGTADVSIVPDRDELAARLHNKPRRLHHSLGYNDVGSYAFERMCETPEYYLTRTERRILQDSSPELVRAVAPNILVDLGSGNMEKTNLLLGEALKCSEPVTLIPCDINETAIRHGIEHILHFYKESINVRALISSYEDALRFVRNESGTKLYAFLGGTIGQMDDDEKRVFFAESAKAMSEEDGLLIGIDLIKNRTVMEKAYNDDEGWCRRNLLSSLTTLRDMYGVNLDESDFDTISRFEYERQSVVSYVVSRKHQTIGLGSLGGSLTLEEGEMIEVEFAEKFDLPEFLYFAAGYGLYPVSVSVESQKPFALVLFRRIPQMNLD